MSQGKTKEELNRVSNEIYDAAIAKATNRHERVLWGDRARQMHRFAEIYRHLSRKTCSVLDVGCGNGELALFLNTHGFVGEYTGVDIHEALLAEARGRYPGTDFRNLDIMSNEMHESFDHVVMSGLFNADFGQDMAYIQAFVAKMFQLCRESVIFNAVSSFVSTRQAGMFYVDPCEMIRYVASSISPVFEVHHGFVPYNFTFVIQKASQWSSLPVAQPE